METKLDCLSLEKITPIAKVGTELDQQRIKIRGFIGTIRCTRYVTFITVREELDTIQCVLVVPKPEDNVAAAIDPKTLQQESFIEVVGLAKRVNSPVKGCSIRDVEIGIEKLTVISPVIDTLPFSLKDAAATEEERAANKSICNVNYTTRLDNRFLDFRMPQTQSIVRIIDGFMNAFREFSRKNGFIEIKTTKMIQSGSEGGSNLFEMKFFEKTAYLAQSPQLYKQMAIAGGLKRVCEVGHVYRAEVSNTNRYLSEFVGLDLEMELEGHYHVLIKHIYSTLTHIFDTIKSEYGKELEILRKYKHYEDIKYTPEPVIITHREAVDLLRENGVEIGYEDDFSREIEKVLGGIMKKRSGVDIFVVTEYPEDCRAFYTYVDTETGKTHSYDFILRGEEILSGAQRIVNYTDLKNAVTKRNISPESLKFYLDCFKFGAPPHGGCGMGLERLIKTYLDFDDIRYFALYPRDPNRLYP